MTPKETTDPPTSHFNVAFCYIFFHDNEQQKRFFQVKNKQLWHLKITKKQRHEIAVTDIVEVDGVMQSMVVDVTPEQGMQLVAIKANGNVIYGQGSTNKSASMISVRKLSETKYELTGFSESDRFEFEFNKSTETSLQTNRLTDATVRVVGSHIEVDGAPSYEVYNLSGRKVPASSSLTPGVYIVVANGESQKVLVK